MGEDSRKATPRWVAGGLGLLVVALARVASATDYTVAPGDTLSLTSDLALTGTDTLTAGAAGGAACTIEGNGHSITSMPTGWSGHVTIQSCTLHGLGAPTVAAIDLTPVGTGDVTIQDSTISASGSVRVSSADAATISIARNIFGKDSIVNGDDTSFDNSVPAFLSYGAASTGSRVFQGNKVLRSWIAFDHTFGWVVGGAQPDQQNIIVGYRAAIIIAAGDMQVRGNFVHPTPPYAINQVQAFMASGTGIVVEHNIIRGGWPVRSIAGEVRYNIIGDPEANASIAVHDDEGVSIHHNLFLKNKPLESKTYQPGIISVETTNAPGSVKQLQIFNNTFDVSGKCYDWLDSPLVIPLDTFVTSLRNNIFMNIPISRPNPAVVAVGKDEQIQDDPGPPRLGYADYNLFYVPDVASGPRDNYGVSVDGKTERMSPGFALNDAMVGGPKDQQMQPQFAGGALPRVFPFSDDDMTMGKYTVCDVLAFFRSIYTPTSDFVVDKGDPADGAGVDIGAVGAGMPSADDQFGKLCGDTPPPTGIKLTTTCPTPIGSVVVTGTGGGGGGIPMNHGFACVCDVTAGDSAAAPAVAISAFMAVAFTMTRRRRRVGR
jgi:hypothetical protein